MGEPAEGASKQKQVREKGVTCKPHVITEVEWQRIKCGMLEILQKKLSEQATGDDWFDKVPGYLAAFAFDSPYWQNGNDVKPFQFADGPHKGQKMTGAEVNYYFQGMYAGGFGVPRGQFGFTDGPLAGTTSIGLEGWVRLWKKALYGQDPSANTLMMAREGYDNYRKDIEECKKRKQQELSGRP